jgi:micrococcal nuclease
MDVFIPKKILVISAGVLILFIGIIIGFQLKGVQNITPVQNNVTQTNQEISNKNAGEINTGEFKVTRVIDGDTIEIEGGERVRYIGIDTPETVDPRKPVQCFGVEASNKNKELVEGKMVRLEKDITDRDKYNRLLRYVYVGDTFINLELVKQGFAYSYSYPPDIKYQEQFVKAQQEAREVKRGLWNACPTTPESISAPAISPTPGDNSCLIKGNINTSGEKIYHLPGCGSYSKTTIDEKRGEKWFCTETEAQSAGWRKALNCP